MSRDDAPEDETESPTADRQREPERVIDADADVEVDPAAEVADDTETPDAGGGTDDLSTADAETAADEQTPSADETAVDGDTPVDSATDTGEAATQTERGDADDTREPAMRSGDGLLLGYGGWTLLALFLQALTTLGLVGVTAQSLPVVDSPLVPPGIPVYVYAYAGVGAVGYTFTRAVTVDVTTERLGDWTVRVFAALPLAAATHLVVTIAVAGGVGGGGELTRRQLALVALLTGLFVNTSYARLDAAAKRLLGPSR